VVLGQVRGWQDNYLHHEEGRSEPPQLVERGRIAFVESTQRLEVEFTPVIIRPVRQGASELVKRLSDLSVVSKPVAGFGLREGLEIVSRLQCPLKWLGKRRRQADCSKLLRAGGRRKS
jgi:hypothetical protein